MFFDPLQAVSQDHWLETEVGQYLFSRQEKIILDLVLPLEGESMLDVGCKTGNFLRLFQRQGCSVSGIDPSREALDIAGKKLGHRCELIQSNAEDLPFSDNEFDIVTIIHGVPAFADPEKVLAEAVRVSRNRVFVGFYNKHSFVGTAQSIRKLFGFTATSDLRFFTFGEMKLIINKTITSPYLTWGSVIYLPGPVYKLFSELEELFPMKKNSLGAFAGMAFPVRYTYRTVQHPIMDSYELKTKTTASAPEAVRGMLQERDR